MSLTDENKENGFFFYIYIDIWVDYLMSHQKKNFYLIDCYCFYDTTYFTSINKKKYIFEGVDIWLNMLYFIGI